MKKTTFFSLFFLLSLSGYSQVTSKYNLMRAGDEILKQQVEYKDPGRAGENVIWNFSQLKQVNPDYKVKYKSPRLIDDSIYVMGEDTIRANSTDVEKLIIGTEHRTMYYYQYKSDTLYCLGHENSTTLLEYTPAIPVWLSPMTYQNHIETSYSSKARYSARLDILTEGKVSVNADAYGNMILPSGDTLKHVTRIRTIQTYRDIDSLSIANKSAGLENPISMIVENYKWYSLGYRYPVFETIHTILPQDSVNSDYYKTAFFYPPQEHYYLTDDYDNLAVLDSLSNHQEGQPVNPGDGSIHPGRNFSYNYYPNPVQHDLYVEYMLNKNSQVSISVYDMQGKEVRNIPTKSVTKGLWNDMIDCSGLPQGSYVLRINVNNEFVNEKIIKR